MEGTGLTGEQEERAEGGVCNGCGHPIDSEGALENYGHEDGLLESRAPGRERIGVR